MRNAEREAGPGGVTPEGMTNLPEGEHFGLIAEQVREIFPEIVTEVQHVGEGEPGSEDPEAVPEEVTPELYPAIDFQELTALLFQAIQDQQELIEDLRARVGVLEGGR